MQQTYLFQKNWKVLTSVIWTILITFSFWESLPGLYLTDRNGLLKAVIFFCLFIILSVCLFTFNKKLLLKIWALIAVISFVIWSSFFFLALFMSI